MTEDLTITDESILRIEYLLAMLTKGTELTPEIYEEISDLLDSIRIISNAKDRALDELKKEIKILRNDSTLADFCKKISKQEDCPAEFVDLVNKEFWKLI